MFLEVDMLRALSAGRADRTIPLRDGPTPLMAAAGVGSGSVGGAWRWSTAAGSRMGISRWG